MNYVDCTDCGGIHEYIKLDGEPYPRLVDVCAEKRAKIARMKERYG